MVGERGDVWVVGAQNAGKSSLVNAMRRAATGKSNVDEGLKDITVAPLPGTTLGEPLSCLSSCVNPGEPKALLIAVVT